ncbi:MAG: GNAT family N-acetyltransferase [Gammaproteobacteria bacterium]
MPQLSVRIAERPDEIDAALRLRYRVFAEEAGIAPMRNAEGIERDEFDDYCDHLIVRDEDYDRVVGVYRLLPGRRVRSGRIYTATEFDLAAFSEQVPHALEIGRSCIDADYRDSGALLRLWSGMLAYFGRGEFQYLMGCASLRATDAQSVDLLHSYFRDRRYAIDKLGIRPLPQLRVDSLRYVPGVSAETAWRMLPCLMKGYLRLGSEVVSEPVYDPLFQTYDFCMILHRRAVTPRYRRHFLSTITPHENRPCTHGSAG